MKNRLLNIKHKITEILVNSIFHLSGEKKTVKESRKINKQGPKEIGIHSFLHGQTHKITGWEKLEIGENVQIDENAFINAEGGVEIGSNTHIGQNFVLSSVEKNIEGTTLPFDYSTIPKKVIIGRNVLIGMNVCIIPGTIIGDGCIIEMGTSVSGIIPPLSIVTSAKCVVTKQRDKDHYNYLEEMERYAGPNGTLYNWGNDKSLINPGDKFLSRRSTSTLIDFNGKKAIQKVFLATTEGRQAFETELNAYKTFQKYNWCPLLLETRDNSIVIEYLNSETRLDLLKNPSKELLEQIVWCLFELFYEGYAHRDFHSKNIFVTNKGIKLIDYETIEKLNPQIDFFESYDITGTGLESPYFTGNMGVLTNSRISISQLFRIKSVEKVKSVLNNAFEKRMFHSSITFRTLRGGKQRHTLQTPKIYASFDLLHTKIGSKLSQRNSQKRFQRFGVNKQIIEGKRILDVGSNIGGTLLNLYKFDPSLMLGLEYDADKVELSKKLARYNGIHNVSFEKFDVETDDIKLQSFDIVFCLALIEHLNNKERLFELLGKTCLSILFFEGNANSNLTYIENGLKAVGFSDVEYIGFSDDEANGANNNRPLFIGKK